MTVATIFRIAVVQIPKFVKHKVTPVTKEDKGWILPNHHTVLNSKKLTFQNCCYFVDLLTKTSIQFYLFSCSSDPKWVVTPRI